MKQPTCEERIEKHMSGRIADISASLELQETLDHLSFSLDLELSPGCETWLEEVVEARREQYLDKEEARDAYTSVKYAEEIEVGLPEQEINNKVLCVDKYTTYRIMYSTGGPADGFWITVDDEGDIITIEYYFQDWFDGARRTLTGSDYANAKEFFERGLHLEGM